MMLVEPDWFEVKADSVDIMKNAKTIFACIGHPSPAGGRGAGVRGVAKTRLLYEHDLSSVGKYT
jgi:hypothetical protein